MAQPQIRILKMLAVLYIQGPKTSANTLAQDHGHTRCTWIQLYIDT